MRDAAKLGLTEKLEHWVADGGRRMGELAIEPQAGRYRLCHVDDVGRDDLESISSPVAARGMALYDDAGVYRPLKSAPDLRHGWALWLEGAAELRQALDYIYPAALGTWFAQLEAPLDAVPLRAVLGRQTGMYRFANKLSDSGAQALVGKACGASSGCLKRVRWELSPGQAVTSLPAEEMEVTPASEAEMPLLCVEACNWLVAKARKAAAAEAAEFENSSKDD